MPVPDHVADLRMVVEGDPSPDGKGQITLARGIEVGHIFQLGTKYSEAMNAGVSNEDGKNQIMTHGLLRHRYFPRRRRRNRTEP